jgi:hypothetical protein
MNVAGIKAYDDNGQLKAYVRPQGTKQITANGEGIDVAQYAAVDVAVPSFAPTLETVEHIVPTESSQTITPDAGYDALSSVQIDGISSSYVGSGITRRSSTDLTASGDTVTVPPGYYETQSTKAVAAGSAGIPTATKGTVSNHAVTVTPSVSNTAGYISGGTKTGTGVSVSASELVSGSETKTQNGTYDVTNLAELIVNVASSGIDVKTATGTFTGNGTRQMTISCAFEPDLIYFTSDPGTTASSGVVAAIIARGLMAATRYRNNSTTNSHYAAIDITNMNTSGSSYSFRATYTNSTVTLYCFSNNARCLFTNNRTYSYTFIKYTA